MRRELYNTFEGWAEYVAPVSPTANGTLRGSMNANISEDFDIPAGASNPTAVTVAATMAPRATSATPPAKVTLASKDGDLIELKASPRESSPAVLATPSPAAPAQRSVIASAFRMALAGSPAALNKLAEIKAAQSELDAKRREGNARGYSPGQRERMLEELDRNVQPGLSADELDQIGARRAQLQGITPTMISSFVHSIMKLDSAQRQRGAELVHLVAVELDTLRKAHEQKENEFFRANGCPVPPDRSPVSRRFADAQRELEVMREGLERHPALPHDAHVFVFNVLEVLGAVARVG
jgi:hypothetical protein